MYSQAFHLEATTSPLENDKCHCHHQKFSVVFNVLASTLKAKALIKQLKEQDYKSMNVSGKVSHMPLCNNKRLQRECWGLGKAGQFGLLFFKQRTVKTRPKANRWEKWRQIQLVSSPPDALMCYCYSYSAMSWKNLHTISPTPPWPFLWAWKQNCLDWLLCLEELPSCFQVLGRLWNIPLARRPGIHVTLF